jgi:hypothetical protein
MRTTWAMKIFTIYRLWINIFLSTHSYILLNFVLSFIFIDKFFFVELIKIVVVAYRFNFLKKAKTGSWETTQIFIFLIWSFFSNNFQFWLLLLIFPRFTLLFLYFWSIFFVRIILPLFNKSLLYLIWVLVFRKKRRIKVFWSYYFRLASIVQIVFLNFISWIVI